MRRVRRDMAGGGEIAMMAVITKAMGAFLVIMLMLLPYYTSNPVTQKISEETTEQVEKAKREVQEAQNKLKNSTLSQEEIEELIRKLNIALALLDEALANIRQLKIENDQLASQVNRLTQEVATLRREKEALLQEIARLEEEIERLKEEIERLKRNQREPPSYWNTVRLEWSGCPGAQLNLYGASDKAGEGGKFNPPPNRSIQEPPFTHDLYLGRGLAGGDTTWVMDMLQKGEIITFYVKYLNPLPGGPLECTLLARWNHLPLGNEVLQNTVRAIISEQQPYIILVRLKVGERGSLSPEPVSDAERQEFRRQIETTECYGLACGLDDPKVSSMFVEAIVARFIDRLVPASLATIRLGSPTGPTERQRGEAVLKALGERFAAKELSYADVVRWTNVLVEPMAEQVQRTTPPALQDFWGDQLKTAGALDEVVDMFKVRASSRRLNPDAVPAAFERAGVTRKSMPLSRDEVREATSHIDQWREQGVEPNLAATIARLVTQRRLTLENAKKLAAVISENRNRLPEAYSQTAAGKELQARLDILQNGALHTALTPAWTKVPPEQSLPLVKQIEPQ